jgi:hypothetical protein
LRVASAGASLQATAPNACGVDGHHRARGGPRLGIAGAGRDLLRRSVRQRRAGRPELFSNREAGILVRDAAGVSIVNNLIYAIRNDGISVGGGGALPSSDALLMNNTLYANAGWGVTLGAFAAPATGTVIQNNILQENQRGGIAAGVGSMLGLGLAFNLNDDGYADDVLPGTTDLVGDPSFVTPVGPDGVLGDDGFADDDFHLQPTSPAIDAGSATAAELGIDGSAVAGRTTDDGLIDLGYHYGAARE